MTVLQYLQVSHLPNLCMLEARHLNSYRIAVATTNVAEASQEAFPESEFEWLSLFWAS